MSITLSRMASYTENVPCVCVCILFHFSQGSLFPKLVHMWLVLSHQQSLQIQRVRIILSVTFDSEMHNKHLKHITRVHTALPFQGHRLRILLPGFRGSFQILLPPHTYMSVRACTTALSYPGWVISLCLRNEKEKKLIYCPRRYFPSIVCNGL